MSKNKEELNELKQQYKELTDKFRELTEEELAQVTGGASYVEHEIADVIPVLVTRN